MTALEDHILNQRPVKAPYPAYVALFDRGQKTTPTSDATCGILSARVAHCESGAYNELITAKYAIIVDSLDIEY